jgi:hypothetical protein
MKGQICFGKKDKTTITYYICGGKVENIDFLQPAQVFHFRQKVKQTYVVLVERSPITQPRCYVH